MILFEKVRWKNFLSTGNQYSEIDFQGSPTTLIVGANGSGKSTVLDALTFGLFANWFDSVHVTGFDSPMRFPFWQVFWHTFDMRGAQGPLSMECACVCVVMDDDMEV